jgi:cell filamentation protein
VELRHAPIRGAYDLAHLQAFHRHIFADIHEWAGEIRTVAIGKGNLFCLPQHIEAFAADVFGRLARADYLRNLGRTDFLSRLAELLGDVNALRPFREGNGRTQRAFLAQLAADAGYTLRCPTMDPDENVRASKLAHNGDNSALRAMLDDLLRPAPLPRAPRSSPEA